MGTIWLIVSFLPRWVLEVILWISYILWSIWNFAVQALAGPRNPLRSCLGCLFGIPLFLIYFALTLVSAPFFILYMLIGRIDIAMETAREAQVSARLDVARATFYWPSIFLFWLMPKFYGVEILGPSGIFERSPVYLLHDLRTDESIDVQPGPKAVDLEQGRGS